MKKEKAIIIFILFVLTVLLTGCEEEEPSGLSPKIKPLSQEYNYIDTSVPIIDAIIDSEAEYRYMQTIHDQYNAMKEDYERFTTQISVASPEELNHLSDSATTIKTDIEYFRSRIQVIDLPGDYRKKVLQALNSYMESIAFEKDKMRNQHTFEPSNNKSNELYEKAINDDQLVQQEFINIMN